VTGREELLATVGATTMLVVARVEPRQQTRLMESMAASPDLVDFLP
jgi:hypothetical protein